MLIPEHASVNIIRNIRERTAPGQHVERGAVPPLEQTESAD